MAYLLSPDDGNDDDSLLATRHPILSFDSVLGTALADGDGTVSGTLTVAGEVPVSATAILVKEGSGFPSALVSVSDVDGTYSFSGVPSGNWAVVFIDRAGTRRGKVAHVEVP